MMGKRHEKLGIKQTIRIEWMDRVLRMLLAGMSEAEIRQDLDSYLSSQKQSGGIGERGEKAYRMAIRILSSWFSPEDELIKFRDDALSVAGKLNPEMWLPLHWAVISASYPFWFNVARQVGRLLNLQDHITQVQIINRLKEQYGDRETVARNARYAVRSFVAWRVLKDLKAKGCYERANPITITDHDLSILLLESALHANPEGKAALAMLLNAPAFFPFQLPVMTGDFVAQRAPRIEVVRYGLNDDLLTLREQK